MKPAPFHTRKEELMTWTRLSDVWVDKPELEDLDFADRWHYLAMIQFCSRNNRFDGIIRNVDARRCSDHPDPARALMSIANAGLVTIEGTAYRILNIDDHVPPPYIRDKAEKDKIRKRRERAHKSGDHTLCVFGSCPGATRPDDVTGDSHADVTRDTGTGQDGTGRADYARDSQKANERDSARVTNWAVVEIGEGKVAS